MIKLSHFAAIFAAMLFLCGTPPARAAEPTGIWLTQKSDARIRVSRCGRAICGTIIWIKDSIDRATGKPPVDDKNPDARKRNRKIVGMRIFALQASGPNKWTGSIYNAEDGKSYAASITVPSPTQLSVQGCAGPFCGSETWRRIGR